MAVSGFERFWNSTLGIPQQVLWRFIRAAQDDNVDLFSKDGLLDPSLIPLLGAFDPDRRDVTSEEMAERLGFGEGFVAELGAGILTDPLTYMTAGLSAGAKASKAAVTAMRLGNQRVGRKVLGAAGAAEFPTFLEKGAKALAVTRDDIVKGIDEVLVEGGLKGREIRQLTAARKNLLLAPEGQTIRRMMAEANGRDLVFGLPFLNKAGVVVAPNEKSWFKFLGRKAPGAKAVAHATRALTRVPVVGAPFNLLASLSEGYKSRGLMRKLGESGAKDADLTEAYTWLTQPGTQSLLKETRIGDKPFATLYADYVKRFDKYKKADPALAVKRALVGAVHGRAPKDPAKAERLFAQTWADLGGSHDIPVDDLAIEQALRSFTEFRDQYGRTMLDGAEVMENAAPTKALLSKKGGARKAFSFGRSLRSIQRKAFQGESDIEAFLPAQKELRTLEARGTEAIYRRGVEGGKLLKSASEELGQSWQETEAFFNSWLQSSSLADELEASRHFTDITSPKAASGLLSIAARLESATNQLAVLGRGGAEGSAFRSISDQIAQSMGRGLGGKTRIQAVFDGPAEDIINATKAHERAAITGRVEADRWSLMSGPNKGRYLAHLTDDELLAEVNRLEQAGTVGERADARNLADVLEARDGGRTAFQEPPSSATVPNPARQQTGDPLELVKGGEEPVYGPLDPLAQTSARLIGAAKEIQRAIRQGTGVGPAVYADALDALNGHGRLMDGILEGALGPKGKAYMEWFRQTQGENLVEAVRNGVVTGGAAPFAYVSRVIGPHVGKVESILRDESFASVIDKALPNLGSSALRTLDSMTIEELNEIYRAAMKESGPAAERFVQTLDEIADETGVAKWGKYTESPHLAMLTRMSQGNQRSASRSFFGWALDAGEATDAMRGGQVVGYVSRTGKIVKYGKQPRVRKTGEDIFTASREDIKAELGALLVQDRHGKVRTITQETLDSGGALVNFGKYTFDPEIVLDEQAVELAFATRASKGPLSPTETLRSGARLEDFYDDLEGAFVAWGEEGAISGAFTAVQAQYAKSHEALVAFDLANQTIKAWQTTLRPAFQAVNVGSGLFQTMAGGASAKNALLGMWDAARFLGKGHDPKFIEKYDRMAAIMAGEKGIDGAIKSIRRGTRFAPQSGDDVMFRFGGQTLEYGEILEAAQKGGLYGTYVIEGLKGSSRASRTAQAIQEGAVETAGLGKKVGRALLGRGEKLQDLTESTEVGVRTAALFSYLREGMPLEVAVENAKLAMVDYAQVTNFERRFLKRFSTYYTFPRHYLPQAWKHFAQDPSKMAEIANTIKSSGVFRERDGRTEVDLGPLGILDAQRLNPNIEALKMTQVLGHAFLTAGTGMRWLDTAAGRQERLERAPDNPFSIGSLPSTILAPFDGDEKTRALDELANTFWLSRYILDEGDPLGEKTPLVKAFEQTILPLKADTPVRVRRALKGRYTGLIAELERKAQLMDDPEDMERLRREARTLRQMVRDKFEEFE